MPKASSSKRPAAPSKPRANLDTLPLELIDEIVAYLNAEMPRGTVKEMGGEAWKVERLMFAMMFSYCICDLCCPDDPPADRKDMDVFPMLVKGAASNLAQVNRNLRATTLESSRKRSIVHSFDDIGASLANPPKASTTTPQKAAEPASTTKTPKATEPVPPAASSKPARKKKQRTARAPVFRPTHARDGTLIRYNISAEEEEVLKAEWERHKHAILYSSSEEEDAASEEDELSSEDERPPIVNPTNPDPTGIGITGEEIRNSRTSREPLRDEWELMKTAMRAGSSVSTSGGNARGLTPREEADEVRRFKISQEHKSKVLFSFVSPNSTTASPFSALGKSSAGQVPDFDADEVAGPHDNIRNLVINFHENAKPLEFTGLSKVDFLKQYPKLQALLMDWYMTPTVPPESEYTTAHLRPVVCNTLERLDIRLAEVADRRSPHGLFLARQLEGIILRLQVPNVRQFQLIHRMPVERRYLKDNWGMIMTGLKKVTYPKLEVVRVSLWLGGGPLKQPFWLWKNALRELLEHFRSVGRRPKIVLCLFYDISDFDDFSMNEDTLGMDPHLRPSLAPTVESMDNFLKANVRGRPDTCDFDLVIHAAPVEDEDYGAERPHVPIVSAQYRRDGYSDSESQRKGPIPPRDFRFRSHGKELGRLVAEVAHYSGEEQQEAFMHMAFRQMAMRIERDPELAAQFAAMQEEEDRGLNGVD